MAGVDLEDFTSRLKNERLADRRLRDEMLRHEKEAAAAATQTTSLPPCAEATQAHKLSPYPPCVSPSSSADKPNEDPLHQPGCIQPGGDSAAGSESTPMPDSDAAPTQSASAATANVWERRVRWTLPVPGPTPRTFCCRKTIQLSQHMILTSFSLIE